MHSDTAVAIRCRGLQAGVRSALVALACIGLADCGGGPGGRSPDLVVEDAAVSEERPAAGASFTFSATVRNAGDRSAAATTLRVYRSDDDTITTDDEQVGADTVEALAAAASRVASVELTAPSSPGTYYYGACVDAAAGESDTANNCSAAVEVTVPEAQDTAPAAPLPDLLVESQSVSADTPAAGARFTFSATVRNAGAGNAAATTLLVYLSEDKTITTADQEVDAATVAALAASASEVAAVELTAPPGAGTYYYGGCVEPVAEESDTANNCSAPVPVTVRAQQVGAPGSPRPRAPSSPRPDLKVVAPWVSPASPAIGGTFRLSMTVRNAGARARAFWIRVYRSDDDTFTESDPRVHGAGFWRPGLPSRSSDNISRFVNTPSTKGEHYYRACAEAVSPKESDTTNNCSAAVKIDVSHAKPDLEIHSDAVGSWVGSSFKLAAGVRNLGGPSAATSLRFYRSDDNTVTTDDDQVGVASVPALIREVPHTAPTFVSAWVLVPGPTTSGTHYYGVCVDAVPGESKTTNNCWGAFHSIRR